MNIKDRQDCESNIRRIEELLACGIFNQENAGHILQVSAFIDLMICLRDLMHKTEKYAQKIDFSDDILVNDYVTDVSDAIRAIRETCNMRISVIPNSNSGVIRSPVSRSFS